MSKNFANDTDVSALENDEPITDEVVEDQVEEDVTSEQPVADEPVEEEVAESPNDGPSVAMMTVAREWLPEQLVSLARDDAQLQEMIELSRNQVAPQPQAEEEEDFELLIPEEDYEVDSAVVRKQFKSMADHYKKVNSGLKRDLSDLIGVVTNLQKEQGETKKFRQQQEQRGFDNVLDSLDSEELGTFGQTSEEQFMLRKAVHERALQIRAKKGGDLGDIANDVVAKMFPGLQNSKKQQNRVQAIKEQSKNRLGSNSNGKRLPEPELSPDQRFDAFLEKLNNRK